MLQHDPPKDGRQVEEEEPGERRLRLRRQGLDDRGRGLQSKAQLRLQALPLGAGLGKLGAAGRQLRRGPGMVGSLFELGNAALSTWTWASSERRAASWAGREEW